MSGPVAITGAATVLPAGDVPLDGLPELVQGRALRAERTTQLLLAAAGRALAAAGLAVCEGAARATLGVVVGTAFGCFLTNAEFQRRFAEGGSAAASPRLFAATVSNAAAGELAIAYRLGGPSVTLTAGAASGLVALGHAADLVRAGRAEAIVAAGVDAMGDALRAWLADGGLATTLAPAEAAAAVVLGTPPFGARVHGTIEGHAAGFEPALAETIAAALDEAGVAPADVALVASRGGPEEERAIRGVVGAGARRIVPERETFGAAGPVALVAALAEAPRGAAVLVVDTCASGHVAALVARAGGPA